jgi:hypothetical protein
MASSLLPTQRVSRSFFHSETAVTTTFLLEIKRRSQYSIQPDQVPKSSLEIFNVPYISSFLQYK